MKICGIDEAGRGSVIGPMVVAGILMDEEEIWRLEDLGVKDSKKLTPEKRFKLSDEIEEIAELIKLVVVDAETVDKSTKKRGAMGLNRLEAEIFSQIINDLKPDLAYIDLPSRNKGSFESLIRNFLKVKCRLVLEHKADEKYPIVSAASILAKAKRDELIEELKSVFGDFGSGYPSDPKTRGFLRKLALKGEIDGKIVRLSWRTLDKVLQRRLEEFEA
ncbi:MAG TPA: ribonuclease HII [Nitrososphaeria archaeon]|nr:MAG: ribonuclease HII [Nitrososphaerota archaeon]HDJ66517.1 ribonuclease HII [Nitrososphaeria archaeon]